jgi:glycosyltransferase involved in cell wall biosynthesis
MSPAARKPSRPLTGRVVLLAHRLARPHATGIGRYVAGLASALARVWSPEAFVLAAAAEAEVAGWVPPGVAVARVPGPRRALLGAWTLLGRPSLDTLSGRPRLVHVLSPFAPVPTAAPVVATVHDLMPYRWPAWYGRGERAGFVRAVERFCAEAAHLVAVSATVAAELAARGVEPDRITVVHPGVDAAFFAPDPARTVAVCRANGVSPGGYLLAVGAVSSRKNAVVVVRALARLAPGERLPLLLAGPPGDGLDDLRAEAARLGVSSLVRHLGYVDAADLPPLVAGAAALVHPSREEGFGLPPLEAMAAGTPVVAADAASLPEVAGQAALLAPPDDPDAWAAAIAALRRDPELRARMVAAGRERAAGFTWERAAAATRAVYERLLGR